MREGVCERNHFSIQFFSSSLFYNLMSSLTFPFNQQVNSLNSEVMSEIQSILKKIQSDSSIKSAVIISGKPGCFIAGADISMLAACKTADQVKQISKSGQQILAEIESSSKPIVAAISGSCLGGGLEVILIIGFTVEVCGNT